MLRRYAILLAVAALSLAACHPTRSAALDPVVEDAGEISIHVINRNRIDVMVYLAHDGIRNRLGLAIAAQTTDFTVPMRVLGAGREYRLLGDPQGVRATVTTETLFGQPGDEVTWQLEDSFARSTVVVH